jgi:hypothetical protein
MHSAKPSHAPAAAPFSDYLKRHNKGRACRNALSAGPVPSPQSPPPRRTETPSAGRDEATKHQRQSRDSRDYGYVRVFSYLVANN